MGRPASCDRRVTFDSCKTRPLCFYQTFVQALIRRFPNASLLPLSTIRHYFMKGTVILCVLTSAICCSSSRRVDSTWTNFKYENAIAYYYSRGLFDEDFVVNGSLNPLVDPSTGIRLSEERIRELDKILSSRDKYIGYPVMDCFLPRHGVVFWDTGKPVGWISVCFECGKMTAYPRVDKEELIQLKTFFRRIGYPVE